MPTLYLIDGYAQFFRAYHAIRAPMTSPVTKEPTNLTFGFVGMLLKLLRGEGKIGSAGGGPDYVALALDVGGDRGTFRSTLYPAYKATRPPPPQDLPVQVDRCIALLEAVGVPVLGSPGFEADDVVAALVERFAGERPDLLIRIVSKDKDLKQLLEPGRVEMYDVHTDDLIDAESYTRETGVPPARAVDILALMGDTVDNVPGVDGIGPKTAAELIAQYGSLEALMARAGEVKGKRGERLREALPRLPLSRELVTLRRDAPVDFDLASGEVAKMPLDRLAPILRELGFNRYQDELRALLGTMRRVTPGACAPATDVPTPLPATAAARAGGGFSGGLFDGLAAASPTSASTGTAGARYECITTLAALTGLVKRLEAAEIISIDTETTSLSPVRAKLCGISVSVEPGTGAYIPVRSPTPERHLDEAAVLGTLRRILEDPNRPKAGHNLKYDLLIFRRHGVALRGVSSVPFRDGARRGEGGFDSMVASYLIDPSRSSHSLDSLALALLNRTNISIKELIGTGESQKTFDLVPIEQATEYAAEDADVALQLRALMLPQLRAMGLMPLFAELEMPLVEVLADLEWNGIAVDPAELDRQRARLVGRIEELRRRINDAAMATIGRTFNPDSPKQLGAVLFNKPEVAVEPGLGLKPVKRTKTGYSTDIEVLEKLAADPAVTTQLPELILEHRQLAKLVGTYLVNLKDEINPETGRIHASFNQTVAATGRLSSSDPNLQNIPIRTEIGREIRRAFVAPPGRVLISADYSQIELRLLAHLSNDPALIEAFHAGQDIHTAVAAQIYGVTVGAVTRPQRNSAKMVNFGIVYGVTAFGLARRLGIETAKAAEIIDAYKKRFSGITTFLQECVEQARRYGYVETMLKRRRPIPDVDAANPSRRALAERLAINSVVQGSAADMIKLAMIDLHARLSEFAPAPEFRGVKMILQIHDELVFEAPGEVCDPVRDLIVERMERAMTLGVPLKAEASCAGDWFEGK